MIGIGNIIQLAGNGGGGGSSDFASITGLPTSNAALNPYLSSITNLENNEYKYLYWASVSSSSGTITIPTNATVLLGEIQGVDALVETIQSGHPTGNSPVTSGGSPVVVSSFDTAGNYVLSGTPSAFPVAVLFVLHVKGKDISNLTQSQIIADEQIGLMIGASVSSDGKSGQVPKPVANEQNKVLTGSGIWRTIADILGFTPVSTTDSRLSNRRLPSSFFNIPSYIDNLSGTEHIIATLLIPANTFSPSQILSIRAGLKAAGGTLSFRVRTNTVPTIIGSTQVAIFQSSGVGNFFARTLLFFNPTLGNTTQNTGVSQAGDGTTYNTTFPFDKSADNYLIFTMTSGVGQTIAESSFISVQSTQ